MKQDANQCCQAWNQSHENPKFENQCTGSPRHADYDPLVQRSSIAAE